MNVRMGGVRCVICDVMRDIWCVMCDDNNNSCGALLLLNEHENPTEHDVNYDDVERTPSNSTQIKIKRVC